MSEAGDRYFLIPDTLRVQPGTYAILSLLQEQRAEVNEAALSNFEVSADTAREHFQATVGPLFEQTVRLLTGGAAPKIESDSEAGHALLREVLATLLGVAPEYLNAHPALLGAGAADLLDQIARTMHSAAAPSQGQRAFARAQLRKIRKQLRAQGISVGDRLDQSAEQLPLYQERFATLVEQCASLLRDEAADPDEQLRTLFDTLERDFGGLVESEAERARRDEQRLREYHASADDAIARSLRAHGITPSIDTNQEAREADGKQP